jgi:hypothetical protein
MGQSSPCYVRTPRLCYLVSTVLRRLHSPRRRKSPHASLHMHATVKLIANLLPPWHHAHIGAFQRSSNRARPSHARPAPMMSRPHSIPPCPSAHQTLASSSLRPLTAMPAANAHCMRLLYMYLARHVPLVACRAVSKLPFRPRERRLASASGLSHLDLDLHFSSALGLYLVHLVLCSRQIGQRKPT